MLVRDGDHELVTRVDEVLHYLWDPIGINDEPGARDEYADYVPQVVALLVRDRDVRVIARELRRIATARMGVDADDDRDLRVGEVLLHWLEWLESSDRRASRPL